MALFSASVLLLLGFIYWSTVSYMGQQTDAIIDAEISGLAERYQLTGLAGLTSLIRERLSRRPVGSSIYLLTDRDFDPLVGNLDRWPPAPETPDGWIDFRLEEGASTNGAVRRARARAFMLRGGFHLLVGRDMRDLDTIRGLIVRTLIWGLAITVILALAGGVMMTRSMVRRIETINEASREIMTGDLSRRIPTSGTGDDFDRLTDNLNSMLDQIEMLMDDVRRVSDNIAHDLRTPLARLRNRLEELTLRNADAGHSRMTVEQTILEADKLLATFNALLRIARIESDGYRAGFAQVDLASLLRDVAELYEPLVEEKGQHLTKKLTADVSIDADRDLLFQAIANLLDNAIKFTPVGGGIELALNTEQGATQIIVADSGPGIPSTDRDKVFQRFYRLEASRTTPGSGLGLSLVAAVAKLHHMQVRLMDNHPGLRVVLETAGVRAAA
jgi:signal transduction histidine kinase